MRDYNKEILKSERIGSKIDSLEVETLIYIVENE